MALPSYVWPPFGSAARGVTVLPFGAGIAVPDWSTPVLWPYVNGAFGLGFVIATGTPGFSSAAPDAASGLWTTTYAGTLYHVAANGTVSSSRALPAGPVYTGCAAAGGTAWVLASSGTVLTVSGTVLGTFPVAANALAGSGSMLAALLPASGLGTMTTAGVTGLIAFPAGLTTPSCLSMTAATPVAIAGWQPAAALAAANAAALSPVDATAMAGVGNTTATLWRAASGLTDAWLQTQSLTGLSSAGALAWTPDGFHVMTASAGAGSVQVLSYAAGVLALTQTVSVAGACGVAIGADSVHALIAQSGQAQAMPLAFSTTWAAGTAVTGLPGITTLMTYGTGAVAAVTNGLAYVSLVSGTWSVVGTTVLGFTPTALTDDPFQNIYAVASGSLAVVNASGTVTGSGAFSGVPSDVVVQQGRVVLSVPAANALYLYGNAAPGSWTLQASAALSLGAGVGLAMSETTLFAMGSGSTVTYGFSGSPFTLTNVVSGAVAQRGGGSWTVTPLGVGQTPSAIGYDVSGNLRVLTIQNTQWVIASGGTVVSSGIVPQVSGQAQIVPMGLSAMTVAPTGMFVATSIPGVLVNIA